MMLKKIDKRVLRVAAILIPLLVVFVIVVMRSGPLSPVEVTVATVENRSINPGLDGIGVVEARYVHNIGPTAPGRVSRILVDVGERVRKGEVLCEMDPVDLDQQILARQAQTDEAGSSIVRADAELMEARARRGFAVAQQKRYGELQKVGAVSEETAELKAQEAQNARAAEKAAAAALQAARKQYASQTAQYRALAEQRKHLLLVAPVDGLVTMRSAEVGNTVVAGQTVIEVVDPAEVWISARFDQHQATGLQGGLDASITLRTRQGSVLPGYVCRVEPLADQVTEELLAKIAFREVPQHLPPIGELAEVVVSQRKLPATPVVPSAGIRRSGGKTGVWLVQGSSLQFREIRIGQTSRDGLVQVISGLDGGERIVVYSMADLHEGSRISIRKNLPVGGKS